MAGQKEVGKQTASRRPQKSQYRQNRLAFLAGPKTTWFKNEALVV
jgi:hypothetical protein